MFESYHPFTDAHRAVLKKHQKNNTSPCIASSDWDPFYSVLKTRVRKTLKDHGIDPKLDRAAPPHRIAYYLFVVGCIVVAAFYHIKVRNLSTRMHRLLCRTWWFPLLQSVCCASTNSNFFVVHTTSPPFPLPL